jgi:hypothetical protein
MSATTKTRRLCRGCLASFVVRTDGMIPSHRVELPEGGRGPECRGAHNPPREPGRGRSHYVIT